jgi:hypothetical protein
MPLQWKPQFWLYFYIFCEESLDLSRLDSTNGPTRAPHLSLIREVQNQMLHQSEKVGWKDLLQLTEQHRCHFFQVINEGPIYLLGTKLEKEITQLCQHKLDMLRDIASNHC